MRGRYAMLFAMPGLWFAMQTFAGDCDDVFLDMPPDGAMSHVVTRAQDGLGMCYASAASQLVDAWRFSHGAKNYYHQTSDLAAAVSYAAAAGNPDIDGGQPCNVANHIKEKGSCDSQMVNEQYVNAEHGGRNYLEYTRLLKTYYTRYHEAMGSWYMAGLKPATEKMDKVQGDLAACLSATGFSTGMIPTPDKIRALLADSNPMAYLKGLLTHLCTGSNMSYPTFGECVTDVSTYTSPSKIRKIIDERLTSNSSQPLGISYCSGMLKKGRGFRGVHRGWALRFSDTLAGCGEHASILMGRTKNKLTGKCQYLIRNSWGKDCSNYASKDWKCEDGRGNIWVDADELTENIFQVQHLE